MMVNALLFYPMLVLTVELAALTIFVAWWTPHATRLVLAVIILIPISPILLLRLFGVSIVHFCDWLIAGRAWSQSFQHAARYLTENGDQSYD